MAPSEAVDAYIEGRISRRTLVRRLVAAGVSIGAAASYAQLLDPAFAQAKGGGWGQPAFHFFARTRILKQSLKHVVHKQRILIEIQSHKDLPYATAQVRLSRPHAPHGWTDSLIAYHRVDLKGPNTQTFALPLNYNPPHSVDALRGLDRAKLQLYVTGVPAGQDSGDCQMSDTVTLRR